MYKTLKFMGHKIHESIHKISEIYSPQNKDAMSYFCQVYAIIIWNSDESRLPSRNGIFQS